jgi:integrase
MRVNFNLRSKTATTTSIHLIIYYGGLRLKFSTKQSVKTRYWNQTTQRAREHSDYIEALLINSELNRIEKETQTQLNRISISGNAISLDSFKALIQNVISAQVIDVGIKPFWEYFEDFYEYKFDRVCKDVMKDIHYSLRKHLTAAEKSYGKPITFDLLKVQIDGFVDHLEHYLMYEAIGAKGEPGLAINTVGKTMKNLKALLNWCFDKDITPRFSLKHIVTRTEEPETIYLNEDEIRLIEQTEPDCQQQDVVKDLFLIGCETGLRFSDFTKIKPHHILQKDIKIYQRKTKNKVTIPISARFRAILEKYNYELPEFNNITEFNKHIRALVERAGINENVTRMRRRGTTEVTEVFKKYELVSSHTARRSFCTNKFIKGMRTEAIMQFSGHKSERTFMRYLKIDSELAAEKYREFF